MSTIPVQLSPTPGFCIKSSSLQPGHLFTSVHRDGTSRSPALAPIAVPEGFKIFLNIAWDKNAPPPDAIQSEDLDAFDPDGWVAPVIVSAGREDTDKAGKKALVFDCVFNPSLKSRALKDIEFKTFLIELALQRVEAQSSLRLSRTLGTPNIASKGKLGPRTVDIPLALFPPSHHLHQSAESVKAKPGKKLIEEVTPETTPSGSSTTPKGGSSKNDNADTSLSVKRIETEATNRDANVSMETPMWSWRRDSESDRLVITVEVPKITRAHIPAAALDLEPNAIFLHLPPFYDLSIDLSLPDAALRASAGKQAEKALTLKQNRDLDVDGARAEWRVNEGKLIVCA